MQLVTDQTTAAMLLIKSLDNDASVLLSEWTGQWYVSARIEVSDGVTLTGLTNHQPTPCGAVSAFLADLKAVDVDDHKHRLVTKAYTGERREWRWNGAAFVIDPGPWHR